MDYIKIYNSLIARGRARILPKETYLENHHIIPRCIGGGNSKDNLVKLTPEEHYLAHQLLTRMYPKSHGLAIAVLRMTHSGKNVYRNNKLYGWVRRNASRASMGIRKLPVMILGNKYPSIKDASKSIGCAEKNLRAKCKSNDIKYIDYYYIDAATGNRTDAISDYVNKKNKSLKSVSIYGTIYKSVTEAAANLKIDKGQITYKCNSPYTQFKDWFYVGDTVVKDVIAPLKRTTSKAIAIDGVEYASVSIAAKSLGVLISTISKRCTSSKFQNYQYL